MSQFTIMLSNFPQGLPEVLYLLGLFFIPSQPESKKQTKRFQTNVINMPVNFSNTTICTIKNKTIILPF